MIQYKLILYKGAVNQKTIKRWVHRYERKNKSICNLHTTGIQSACNHQVFVCNLSHAIGTVMITSVAFRLPTPRVPAVLQIQSYWDIYSMEVNDLINDSRRWNALTGLSIISTHYSSLFKQTTHCLGIDKITVTELIKSIYTT